MHSPHDLTAAPSSGATRPRVLAVVTFFPWPQDHGDALRRFMLLEALAASSELTAVCIRRPETTDDDVRALRQQLGTAHVVVRDPWQSDLRATGARVARVTRGLATRTPPWVYRQWGPDVARTVRELCREPFDLAVLVGEPAGVFADAVRASRVLWDKSNVLTASDLDALRTVSSVTGKARALTALPFHWAFERRALRGVDEVVVTSDEEGGRLRRHFGSVPATTIPSALRTGTPAPGLDPHSRTLLWLSTLSYTPNWDGLLRFLDASGAHLRDGGWTLRVVGAGASDRQVAALESLPYVDYRGYVPELADACAGVAAGVVPVWAGAGVKLKTLTLMSLGVPLLATPVALEGIPHEAALRVVHTPADFPAALQDLDPASLRAASLRGREILERDFSREAFIQSVVRLVPPSA
ncbi:glycosyltransferase [Geodermatophilus sp. URMC 64]